MSVVVISRLQLERGEYTVAVDCRVTEQHYAGINTSLASVYQKMIYTTTWDRRAPQEIYEPSFSVWI